MKKLAVFALTLGLAAPSLFAQNSIEQIAPENSIVVASVADMNRSMERLRRTPLYELWNAPEMTDVRKEMADSFENDFAELLRELGLEKDVQWYPSGSAGMAVFTVVDAETGRIIPAMVAFADYGASAAQMAEAIQKMLARQERDGEIEYEEKDILGRTVYAITPLESDDDMEFDFEDEFDFGFNPFEGLVDFSAETMYYVRNGDALMICTDLGALTEILDGLDKGGKGGLADRADYRTMMDRIGPGDAHMILLTRDLMKLIQGIDGTGMASMFGPIAKSVIGDINAIGSAMTFDGPKAMCEMRMMVHMPNGKSGLSKLVDAPAPRGAMPPYVNADALSYSVLAFQFSRVAEVAREIVQANPMLQFWAGEVMDVVNGPVHDFLSTLGNSITHASSMTRPITMDSVSQLFAFEVKRPQDLENQVAMWAPEMGLEPRDFLGHRIFSSPAMGMMMEMALGLGGGRMFLGTERDVEQGLRSLADRDRQGGLADDAAFKRALALLPDGPVVAWGYIDMVSSLEVASVVERLSTEQMMEELRREFPELAAEIGDDMDEQSAWDKMDPTVLRRYLGPMIWQVQSTSDGFVAQAYMLGAEAGGR